MKIGYACLTVGVWGTKQRSCTMKTATPEALRRLISLNLDALDKLLDYNIENGIPLFRISSDIIPFGSHPLNTLKWWEDFGDKLGELGQKAQTHGMRLSMHPGQYTVLNSPDQGVTQRAVEDLRYHARFLDALGLGKEHKIVIHIGGIYGDKTAAARRFVSEYRCLEEEIRKRLVIENDDRRYTISDVLSIGQGEKIPVVFDNLHHQVNPDNTLSEREWIAACGDTWTREDGPQKLHYSQQDAGKRPGAHSSTLDVDVFLEFYRGLPKGNFDIMVEVKDKNLSAIKCRNAMAANGIKRLEKEWGRYKYLILERSPENYLAIRQLLKDKTAYPVSAFYRLVDEGMKSPVTPGNAVNAAQHVWGYVRDLADQTTRDSFARVLEKVGEGQSALSAKRLLWKLSQEQEQKYLLDSLYFMELF